MAQERTSDPTTAAGSDRATPDPSSRGAQLPAETPVTSIETLRTALSVSPPATTDASAGPGALAGMLRELINDAEQAGETLESTLARIRHQDEHAVRASVHLQERLKLGARMLKAFQAQIDRAEATVAHLNGEGDDGVAPPPWMVPVLERHRVHIDEMAHDAASGAAQQVRDAAETLLAQRDTVVEAGRDLERHWSDFEALLARAEDQFASRLTDLTTSALAQFDTRLAEQQRQLDLVDQMIIDARTRSQSMLDAVESAEVNITSMTHRGARAATSAQEASETLQQAVPEATASRESLLDTVARAEAICAACRDAEASALAAAELCEERHQVMQDDLRAVEGLLTRLEAMCRPTANTTDAGDDGTQLTAELTGNLERLADAIRDMTRSSSSSTPEPPLRFEDHAFGA